MTQVLEPGTYYAFNTESTEGPPDPKSVPALEVTGEESGDDVEGEATVSAIEYGFEADEVPSGNVEIDFDNSGAQPHHLIASLLIGDSTAEDVERFFKTNKGKPPLSEKGTTSTAVIEGGEGQVVMLDLNRAATPSTASSPIARAAHRTPSRAWSTNSRWSSQSRGRERLEIRPGARASARPPR